MKYMIVSDGYVVAVGEGVGRIQITESKYCEIKQKYANAPAAATGYQYCLRADNLEWELVELPPVEPEPLTDEAALTRYANELTGQNDPDLLSAAETMITKLARED